MKNGRHVAIIEFKMCNIIMSNMTYLRWIGVNMFKFIVKRLFFKYIPF